MGELIFWGAFLGVLVGIGILVQAVRRKLRRFSRQVLQTENIMEALSEEEESPRSVSGLDSILLPQILRDFPDFDVNMAKTYAKEYLKEQLKRKKDLVIHKIVLSRYLPSEAQKTIVMQAAAGYRKDGKKRETRYELHYTYLLRGSSGTVAANCPNCGATLGYGETECAYCGARVVNVMGNSWEFTELTEIQ